MVEICGLNVEGMEVMIVTAVGYELVIRLFVVFTAARALEVWFTMDGSWTGCTADFGVETLFSSGRSIVG